MTNWWEIVVLITMAVITFWHTFLAGKYLWKLHKDIDKKIYIDNDYHHSHAHFWIVGILMILSILMFVHTFHWDFSETFMEHLFYNLACIFVILPHLQSET